MKKLLLIAALLPGMVTASLGAITFPSKIHEKDSGAATSLATSSWAPTANQPVWMMVSSGEATATATIPTASGNGMTWVQIVTAADPGGTRRITYFRALGVASPTTGATTIDFAGQSQVLIMVDIVELNGADNTAPIVQYKTRRTTAISEDGVTLDNAFSDTANATLGGVFYNSGTGGITPGTGFTELTAEQTHTSPNAQQEIEWQAANDTTVTWTISGSFSDKLCGGFEIKTAVSTPPPQPSTVSMNHLTAGFTDSTTTTYTTASITPVANEPTFVAIGSWKSTNTVQPTVTGCGITWSLVKDLPNFATGRSVYIFGGVDAAPTTGTLTITYSSAPNSTAWSVDGLTGADTATPSVQSTTNSAFAQALTVTLAAFSNANNATYGVTLFNDNQAITEGSGFAEITEQTASAYGFEVEFQSSNDTTVNWTYGGGANKNAGGIAVEVKVGAVTTSPAITFLLED